MSPEKDLHTMIAAGVVNKKVAENLCNGNPHTALEIARQNNPDLTIEPTNDELLAMSNIKADTLSELTNKYASNGLIRLNK